MSINSMNSRFAMAEKMSIPQLQQSIQAGSLPAYVGVPLLEQRMQEQKKAAAMAQLAQAQQQAQQFGIPSQTPIAQGIMEKASGIDDMPSNLPVAGYNDGGIVAFAEGGDAEDFDYEEYQDEQDAEEYNNILRAYMAEAEAAGIEGIPVHRTKKVEMGVEKKADGGIIGLNGGGIPRFQSAGQVEDPRLAALRQDPAYLNFVEDQGGTGRDASPEAFFAAGNVPAKTIIFPDSQDTYPHDPMRNEPRYEPVPKSPLGRKAADLQTDVEGRINAYRLREQLYQQYSDPASLLFGGSDPDREAAQEMLKRIRVMSPSELRALAAQNNPSPATAVDTTSPVPQTTSSVPQPTSQADTASYNDAIDSTMSGNGIRNLNAAVAPAGGNKNVASGGDRVPGGSVPARERPKSAFEDFIANIKEERAALNKQKQDDKYMALLTAGLGMMSGTSPNAFANIGQGAQAGVAQYGASAKQRAAERAALNKNLLMGQRYQSMEDIAGRTADINEARYREIAARSAAGGSGKEDEQNRRRLNDMGNLAQRYEKTLVDQLKLKFNPDIYPKEFAAGLREISKDPRLQMYNSAINKLSDQMYGFSSETQQTPPPSGNVIQYDNKGNRIK